MFFEDVTATHLPAAANRFTMNVDLLDVEGDGDLDLLLAVEFGQSRLLLNDGEGLFVDATAGRLPSVRHDSEDIGTSDFDGDGDVDVVVVLEDDRTISTTGLVCCWRGGDDNGQVDVVLASRGTQDRLLLQKRVTLP